MLSMLPVGLRARILLCGALLLACTAPVIADPKPLSREEQAKVDKAIEKGVAFLKKAQMKEGRWPSQEFGKVQYLVGQCALPAYALLESGVPADDPVIRKAAYFLRTPLALSTDRTYDLALALLFFDRLGDPKDKPLIRNLALRLIAGQHVTGGWNYRCPSVGKDKEEILLKALAELDKRQQVGTVSMAKLARDLRLPSAVRILTVFHDPRQLPWRDGEETEYNKNLASLTGATDNSNTQFALLGLWAAQRHDIPVGPALRLMVERFERTQRSNGDWPYLFNRDLFLNDRGDSVPRPSMICVGLLGLAIGHGMKLPAHSKPQAGNEDLPVLKGLTALSQDMDMAVVGVKRRRGFYYLWSIERVGMLYNLPVIGDKDWYRWGVGPIILGQNRGGEWTHLSLSSNVIPESLYGSIINTSFALLFLKRSHPMKELTPKLPFSARQLNDGIARLQLNDTSPLRKPTTSSESRNSEKRDKPSDQ